MEDSEICAYLSFLECVGERGDVPPKMHIVIGKQHLKKLVKENNLYDNVALAVRDSGYSKDEISLK